VADPNTLRILSLDGGGTRGILSATFMKRFVELWGINPNEIWKHFDVICGTSIGGITGLGYSTGLSPAEAIDFIRTKSPWIFSTSSILPGIRATTLDKLATMILGGSFYPNDNLKAELSDEFGTDTMQACLTNTLISAYDRTTDTPILYSNIDFPTSSGQEELIANVALATSAAPLYLPNAQWAIGEGLSHQFLDGACIKNNPEGLGYALGKIIKPGAKRVCILSLGTGLGDIGFHTVPDDVPPDESNMSFVFSLLGIIISGSQETDSEVFNLVDQYSLEQLYRYRFQCLLSSLEDTEIDNSSSDYFDYMQETADDYFDNDIVNISNFLAHLTA
jgi:hypothetical protein